MYLHLDRDVSVRHIMCSMSQTNNNILRLPIRKAFSVKNSMELQISLLVNKDSRALKFISSSHII